MIQEFKDFVNRGNIIELAVAFVMGVAFAAVINTFVDRLINPLIALLLPGIDRLAGLGTFGANGSVGAVLGAVINFLVVAWFLFLVVRAYNRMQDRREEAEGEALPSEEITLLTEIRDSLRSR